MRSYLYRLLCPFVQISVRRAPNYPGSTTYLLSFKPLFCNIHIFHNIRILLSLYFISTYRVFIKYCVFSKNFRVFQTLVFLCLLLLTYICACINFLSQDYQTYFPMNPVSWTMNTLFFFYLVFPPLLHQIKSKDCDVLLTSWVLALELKLAS